VIVLRDLQPLWPNQTNINDGNDEQNYEAVATCDNTPVNPAFGQKSQLENLRRGHAKLRKPGLGEGTGVEDSTYGRRIRG
jgi:hypothetical protein